MADYRIDLGCGDKKKEGLLGVDRQSLPGVDYVVDFEHEPLPFPDRSVAYAHISHALEHVEDPVRLLAEITRVCRDGARVDIWSPYAWGNSAFVFTHKTFFNEDHFFHPCVWFPDFWADILHGRWLLHAFTYIVEEPTLRDLARHNISAGFAIRYLKDVVKEFGIHVEVRHDTEAHPSPPFGLLLSTAREAPRFTFDPPAPMERETLENVLRKLKCAPASAEAEALSREPAS